MSVYPDFARLYGDSPALHSAVSAYEDAQRNALSERGHPSAHICADCAPRDLGSAAQYGVPAREWVLDAQHGGAVHGSLMSFSPNAAAYLPLCAPHARSRTSRDVRYGRIHVYTELARELTQGEGVVRGG